MIKLCQNGCTCDELVDGDSLKLLFKIISSTCEQHNVPWRQTATDALLTLTKCFNLKSIEYIHRKNLIYKFAKFKTQLDLSYLFNRKSVYPGLFTMYGSRRDMFG